MNAAGNSFSNLRPLFVAALLLAFSVFPSAQVKAQIYQVVIYQPPAGFSETRGDGIAGSQRVGSGRIAGAVYPENTHALFWTGNSATPVDLHPSNWVYSKANATNGLRQVGYVEGNNPPYSSRRAALWNGSAASLVLLSPLSESGYSEALSIAGDQQVGYIDRSFGGNEGGNTYIIHALLWRGTPESVVDLHPPLAGANAPGDQRSWAVDTDGNSQVGRAYFLIPIGGGSYTSEIRALLWHGTAQSAVSLHPQGWDASYATAVKNNTQVGYGYQEAGSSPTLALVWHGTAASLKILGEGTILDTNGNTHVGTIASGYFSHAFRWDGDTGNGFDLHTLLPPGYNNSGATGIDSVGNIIGWAQNSDGYLVGVLWTSSASAPTVGGTVVRGQITTSEGVPLSGVVVALSGTQSRNTITDSNGEYNFGGVTANGFYTVSPSRSNYTFNPATRSFSQVGQTTEATFAATAVGVDPVNPLDTPGYFVRQHYLDFLGREPDEAGFNFWSDQILSCGTDADCIDRRRQNVSAAYFLSIEFQETGGLIDGLYRASYGARPNFAEFMPGMRAIASGLVVGEEGWQAKLQANKQAFVNDFVNHPRFVSTFGNMSNAAFVDALIVHTGITFTASERDALVSGLTQGTQTRADVLRSIAENSRFVAAKFNETFVMMEYFGYLRRDPDASGFAYWLNKLNQFHGNFEQAEMVKAFIVSGEYRERFPR